MRTDPRSRHTRRAVSGDRLEGMTMGDKGPGSRSSGKKPKSGSKADDKKKK
jgi:hypothetical protein